MDTIARLYFCFEKMAGLIDRKQTFNHVSLEEN